MANHLAQENSRYLRQHAENPVDWYPWGDEALGVAMREDKPIFLSIGYSACHWCHVMAHESFEDKAVAQLLNAHFVSIKVDREERPDLDRLYMGAVQAMTGNGGWPMSIFLFPDGTPFCGGTYFPPRDRYGMPSFRRVLESIIDAWEHRRDELAASGDRVVTHIQRDAAAQAKGIPVNEDLLSGAASRLLEQYDREHGGWGAGPKFPQPMAIEFLLSYGARRGDSQLLHAATHTLGAMARGGIYDQLGGGFHRYSVDGQWDVPHFEKMLYDNAQLARLYLHAWQATGRTLFKDIVQETIDHLLCEMRHIGGGFFATQDADSEGQEGKFFLWSVDEIRAVLGDRADSFMSAYAVSDGGDLDGRNVLRYLGTERARRDYAQDRRRLCANRSKRARPGRDDKVLLSWNGLMLRTLAEVGVALRRPDYIEVARMNAQFILRDMRDADGTLHHVWQSGTCRGPGFAEDYAALAHGLLALYEATFEPSWYRAALEVAQGLVTRFAADVGFYDTAHDQHMPVARQRTLQDNAMPSANALAASLFLRLSRLQGETVFEDLALASLQEMSERTAQHPLAFGQWLLALDDLLAPDQQMAIVSRLGDPLCAEMLRIAREGYHPHRVILVGEPGQNGSLLPACLRDRKLIDEGATAYVCEGHVCLPPVAGGDDWEALLSE